MGLAAGVGSAVGLLFGIYPALRIFRLVLVVQLFFLVVSFVVIDGPGRLDLDFFAFCAILWLPARVDVLVLGE